MVGGRFTQIGTSAELYDRPVDLVTASLVGDAVVVPGVVSGNTASTALGQLSLREPVPSAGPAQIMVRPEQITVTPDETGDAVVTGSDYFGHDQLLALSWLGSGLHVRARVLGAAEVAPGQRVRPTVAGTGLGFS